MENVQQIQKQISELRKLLEKIEVSGDPELNKQKQEVERLIVNLESQLNKP